MVVVILNYSKSVRQKGAEMTNDIIITIRQGFPSGEFRRLLKNYGYWAHTTGCKGWGHGGADLPTPAITDETALEIDKAVGTLKREHPNLSRVFTLFYIKQLDVQQITSIIRRRGIKEFKYITAFMVGELITRAERVVFEALEDECESVYLQADRVQKSS